MGDVYYFFIITGLMYYMYKFDNAKAMTISHMINSQINEYHLRMTVNEIMRSCSNYITNEDQRF